MPCFHLCRNCTRRESSSSRMTATRKTSTRGHIDSMVRRAIELGLDPVEAIRLASYNTAQYFRLYNRGAIAPGFVADLVVLDDLHTFQVQSVYKDGQIVVQHGHLLAD